MARDDELPPGWDSAAPDLWPETLQRALETDIGALASPRVISTLRAWRSIAAGAPNLPAVAQARARLAAVAKAIAPELSEDGTITDTAIRALPRPQGRGASAPSVPRSRGLDQSSASQEATVWAWSAKPAPRADEEPTSPPVSAGFGEEHPTDGNPRPPKPRASIVRVRALYTAILPLCAELIPLNVERRSRRFWSLWREASGDRGVRREVVEAVLAKSRDVRTLASELIAEVQAVDLESVRAMIDRVEAEGSAKPSAKATPDGRGRGALVGASVRDPKD